MNNRNNKPDISFTSIKKIDILDLHFVASMYAHFRPDTIDVLTDMLPQLHDRGVELVHVSKLIP